MNDEKKLEFIHKMSKLGLHHYDSGGVLPGIANALTVTNPYQAQAPTSAGTVGQQQAGLASQLQTESAGGGPNPAQSQYLQNAQEIAQKQATNFAQNRALNPGLAARMAGNVGAETGQVAASQAGTQQAQQQLAAQAQLQGLTGQEQAGYLGAAQINAGVAGQNAQMTNNTLGGLLGGGGAAAAALFAKGGEVSGPEMMADGGALAPAVIPSYSLPTYSLPPMSGGSDAFGSGMSKLGSAIGKRIKGPGDMNAQAAGDAEFYQPGQVGTPIENPSLSPVTLGGGAGATDLGSPLTMAAHGGEMPEHLSHIHQIYHSHNALKNPMASAQLMKTGGPVQAKNKDEKAKVQGDSYSNDKIPAMLSEGELVIDRDTMQDKGPVGQMARALAAHIKSRNGKKK